MKTAEVAKLTGYTPRWVAQQATKGMIPGARKVGVKGHWTFEDRKVKKWWNSLERKPGEWQPYIREAISTGQSSNIETSQYDEALRQLLDLKP